VAGRVKIREHHVCEAGEIRRLPAGINSQEFSGKGKVENGNAHQTRNIGAAGNYVHRRRPGVKDVGGLVGVIDITGNIPPQRIQIRRVGVEIGVLAAGAHVCLNVSVIIAARLAIGDQFIPVI
jgi:hypothetical protein